MCSSSSIIIWDRDQLLLQQDMDKPLRVLITGTSKGIGQDLVKIFLSKHQNSLIYATSRQSPEVAYGRWKDIDPSHRVHCKYLDINHYDNIQKLAQEIKDEKIQIDILINNAAVCRVGEDGVKLPDPAWAKECLQTNLISQIQITQAFLPYLSDKAKVVSLSSKLGAIKYQPEQTQQKFSNENINKEDILSAASEFVKEAEKGVFTNYSIDAYGTSKMLLGAWSRFILQKKLLKNKQIAICVTPGLCLTPMTKNLDENTKKIAHSSYSGAEKIFQTIFYPDLDPNVFYHRGRKSDFYCNGDGLPWQ